MDPLKSRERRDLTKGNLLKKILLYLTPLFLSSVLQLLFTTSDIFVVTHFGGGNSSSGAIGATASLINLILCFFWGITSGASAVIANAKGAKDVDKVTRSIGSATLIMLISSFVVGAVGAIFCRDFLILMETDAIFLDKATLYLRIYFIGTPFNLLFNTGASILRAFGDSRRPFVSVVVAGVINVILNLFFVIVCNLDVAGVALATITSQAIMMVVNYGYLMKDKRLTANFRLKYLKIYKDEALDILRLGIASGLQAVIFNITNVNIQRCANTLGAEAVIGKTAASNIEGYEYALLNTISQTCLVAVGQNYGAKQKKRITQSFILCMVLELVLVTTFDLLVLALNKPLLSIFINSSEPNSELAIEYAISSLMIMGIPYAFCGIPECCSSYLRGMKYALVPTLVSLLCIVGSRLFFIYVLFPLEQFHTFSWLIWTYPISWFLCCFCYIPTCIILGKKRGKLLDSLYAK